MKHYDVEGEKVFTAVYVVFFASFGAGNAVQYGP